MPSTATTNHAMHWRVWMLAWPLLLSNLTAPLMGLVDTAVVGHLDSPTYLAAVALGSNYFMVLYFAFGFLRMGTTGLASQAKGGNHTTVGVLLRSLILALALGALLILINSLLKNTALDLFGGSADVTALAAVYIDTRILGAPAALANYALIGFAIGIHRTRIPLKMTLLMHGSNALLSVSLVYIWHLDIQGIAAASAIADYLGLFAALYWLRNDLPRWQAIPWRVLRQLQPFMQLISINRDLFIRSLALLGVFFFFTAQGARLGDTILAANAILLTFLLLLSNLLDGFANAAEALVGEAVGATDTNALRQSVTTSGHWSLLIALLAFIALWLGGTSFIHLLTDLPMVRATATAYLPWIWLLPLTASAGFWLDGVFVGATRAVDMRNTMLFSVVVFFVTWWLTLSLGNHGLWLSMNLLMGCRGLAMAYLWWARPSLAP